MLKLVANTEFYLNIIFCTCQIGTKCYCAQIYSLNFVFQIQKLKVMCEKRVCLLGNLVRITDVEFGKRMIFETSMPSCAVLNLLWEPSSGWIILHYA